MKKSALILSLFILASQVSFTQVSFASNSGKVKAKVAKKEAKEAKNDTAYQSLMKQGHELFKNNEFESAITKYENAAKKRPINVYPRVKIADVKLAMLSYVEEEPEPEVVIETPLPELDPIDEDQDQRVSDAYEEDYKKVIDSLPPPPADVIEPKEKEKDPVVIIEPKVESDIPKLTVDQFAESLGEEYSDGVTEEVFEEGTKKITRRIVVKDGKGADYRKVVHRWGGVFYFKNDEPITEHTWNIETVLED